MTTRAQTYDRDTALSAAQDVFWRKGYHATSLKDLEGALSMKPGSIYSAFKSKENLYLLSLERYFQHGKTEFDARVASAASPLQALADHARMFGRAKGGSATNRSCMLIKTVLDTTEADGVIGLRAREYLDAMCARFAAAFRAAVDQGEIAPDSNVSHLAQRYQTDITALRIEAHRGTAPDTRVALAEETARNLEALRAT